jgi:hypothetical protein
MPTAVEMQKQKQKQKTYMPTAVALALLRVLCTGGVDHGLPLLFSPTSEPHNYWNWVVANSKAACVRRAQDPVTNATYPPLALEMRNHWYAAATAAVANDTQAWATVVERRQDLHKVLIKQLMQASLAAARMASPGAGAQKNYGACYSACKGANPALVSVPALLFPCHLLP